MSSTETELSNAHPEWSAELAPFGVSRGALSGGFVESIVIDAGTMTYQEMSRYEWFATQRATELAAKFGHRGWIYPSNTPGDPPVDLEQLLAQTSKGW